MTSNAGLGELVRELRATLEAIGARLVEGLPDRLLDAEPRLAEHRRPRSPPLPPIERRRRCAPELVARAGGAAALQRLGATVARLGDVYATRARLRPLRSRGTSSTDRRRRRPAGEGLMSGLFGMLSTTARALDAQRYGLDVAGQNIANVNTARLLAPRRRLRRGAADRASASTPAAASRCSACAALRDRFFDRRLFAGDARPQQREAAIAESLGIVEAGLGAPGASIDARLDAVLRRLRPRSPRRRRRAPRAPTSWRRARRSPARFSDIAGRLERGAARRRRAACARTVDEINALADQHRVAQRAHRQRRRRAAR